MEPGEDGEVEAQRRLHQWLCHERPAIAMALADVQHVAMHVDILEECVFESSAQTRFVRLDLKNQL